MARNVARKQLIAHESGVRVFGDPRVDPDSVKPPFQVEESAFALELAQAREEAAMLREDLAAARSRLAEAKMALDEAAQRAAAFESATRLLAELREVAGTLERLAAREKDQRPTVMPPSLDVAALMRSVPDY